MASDSTTPDLNEATLLARTFVGPWIIGAFFNVLLFGILCMQMRSFYRHPPKDSSTLKIYVAFLFALETLNVTTVAYTAYGYAIKDFGNINATTIANSGTALLGLTGCISTLIVRVFFGLQVKRLTKWTLGATIIIILAIIDSLFGISIIIAGPMIIKTYAEFHKIASVVIIWLALAPVIDIAISTSLLAYLRYTRTGTTEPQDMIASVSMVFQTGTIVAIWAAGNLAIYLTISTNLHFILNVTLAKLYANCLLAFVNARPQWGNEGKTYNEWPLSSSEIRVTTTTGVRDSPDLPDLDFVSPASSPSKGQLESPLYPAPADVTASSPSERPTGGCRCGVIGHGEPVEIGNILTEEPPPLASGYQQRITHSIPRISLLEVASPHTPSSAVKTNGAVPRLQMRPGASPAFSRRSHATELIQRPLPSIIEDVDSRTWGGG